MIKFLFFFSIFMSVCFLFPLSAQVRGSESNPHILNPSSTTVAWGHYWSETPPVLRIKSGDRVRVHTLLTSNPMRLERMGLPPEEVEKELREVQTVTNRGPGGHVLTGPIYIEEAEPGNVLEVQILSIELAIPYGYNSIEVRKGVRSRILIFL